MEYISFDQFSERLKDETPRSLKAMAAESGLDVDPGMTRKAVLRLMYQSLEMDAPSKNVEPEPVEPEPVEGEFYHVMLHAKAPRWRGKRLWDKGMTRVPTTEMSAEMLKVLDKDKAFKVVKVTEVSE
jgi:hypothetical protein